VTQVPHATTGKISIENEVQRIRALLKDHRFAEAVNDATALRTAYPENRDLLYLLALGLRHMRRIPAALEVLGELERHHPRMSALFQERGHCYVALKDAVSAIQAYEQAVRINPALPDAWSMLERLQLMVGNADQSRIAAEHVRKLRSVPPEVIRATGLFCEGDLALAERIVRGYLLQHSNQVEAMRLLARIGIAQDILDDGARLHRASAGLRVCTARPAQARRSDRTARPAAGHRLWQHRVSDSARHGDRGTR
jgi:tetratricopeptide (TPR) repeat protein